MFYKLNELINLNLFWNLSFATSHTLLEIRTLRLFLISTIISFFYCTKNFIFDTSIESRILLILIILENFLGGFFFILIFYFNF